MTEEELNRRFDSLEARIIHAMREVETNYSPRFTAGRTGAKERVNGGEMTIDERLQFLLQSTESLHQSVNELVGICRSTPSNLS